MCMKTRRRRMVFFSLLILCFLSLTHAAAKLQSSDNLMIFALLGDDVTLPCGIPFINSCSSINWSMAGEFGSVSEVVEAGKKMPPNNLRLRLLKDCSLKINQLVHNDARIYFCGSGELKSNVSLHILELTENSTPADGTIELQCFLNTYIGYDPCNNKSIHIKWSTDDNTPLSGNRFHSQNPSECFSKLIINKKLTDHHRKWKCHLFQNDMVRATISYTTTIKDGIEEVFAAVGESVSFPCSHTSSLGVGGNVRWDVAGRTLSDDMSPDKGQTGAFDVSKGSSSLVISKVSALHAGDYQCSESTGQQIVLNKIRLHTVDVRPTSEREPGGDNFTLTCVLTCARECEEDFRLTWSGNGINSWQSGFMNENNTLRSKLVVPVLSATSEELTCLVLREGHVMASKKWHTVYSLQTPAWLALPLGLLICISAGGLYICKRRKYSDRAGNEQPSIEMIHVYDDIQDPHNEGLQTQRKTKAEAATEDSFYDLLQAVH